MSPVLFFVDDLANVWVEFKVIFTGFSMSCTMISYFIPVIIIYDTKTFGNERETVVDIPTTLAGNLFTSLLKVNKKTLKGIIKRLLKNYLIRKKIIEINFLLNNKLVISIQEHIAPGRNDGKRQIPNIFDDKESLFMIFNYLKNKNVWYCTGTELSEYYLARAGTAFEFKDSCTFIIKNAEKYNGKFIFIKTDDNHTYLKTPDNQIIKKKNNCFTFQISADVYKLGGDS